MTALYKYQEEGIERLYNIVTKNPEKAAMLCDPPGAGKTPQAIGLFMKLQAKKALVICPASMKETWRREFASWSRNFDPSCRLKITIIQSSTKPIDETADIYIMSFNMAVRIAEIFERRFYDLLIVDEAHYCKNPTSQTSRMILIPIWARCQYRLLMTGTPLPNGRACEAWTTFSRCDFENLGSWKAFRQKFCVEQKTPWGTTYSNSKNLGELKHLSQRFLVRRTKDEVLHQLPGLVRQNIYFDLPEYEILEAQGGIDVDAIVSAVELGLPVEGDHITTVRRKIAMLKAKKILEHIEETLEEVECVVVFLHHRDLFSYLAGCLQKLQISYVAISGLTPLIERTKSVDIFQAGNARVFLASLKAANTGLTLTRASTLIMAEYDWVPSTNEQAEGRIYRVSQKEICRVRYLVAADSLDEKILRVVQQKQKDIEKVVP